MFRVVVGKGYNLRDNRDDDLFRNHHSFANILKVQYAPSLHLSLKEIVHSSIELAKKVIDCSFSVRCYGKPRMTFFSILNVFIKSF